MAHGPVGHHHGVGVAGEEHGLRVDRGPELGHLRVAAHAAHVAHAHGALAAREVLHTWNNEAGSERGELRVADSYLKLKDTVEWVKLGHFC